MLRRAYRHGSTAGFGFILHCVSETILSFIFAQILGAQEPGPQFSRGVKTCNNLKKMGLQRAHVRGAYHR